MQQRYYDPIAGRFLSVDPVTTDAGNGALFNRYMYAANNPFTLFDPDGRCTGSRITNSDGTCKSTGGFTTGTDGMVQGMQVAQARAAVVAPPAGAANAPGGQYIEPTWAEIGAVADGAATAASLTPLGAPLRARGLITPSRYFGSKTKTEASEALAKKLGPARSSREGAETFYNDRTKRSFNVHHEKGHMDGKPHVDVRRRGDYPERKYMLKENE